MLNLDDLLDYGNVFITIGFFLEDYVALYCESFGISMSEDIGLAQDGRQ